MQQTSDPPRRLPEGFDSILLNGRDPQWQRRRRIRERNTVRQDWEGWLERHQQKESA